MAAARRQILRAFLNDALRLSTRASECLSQITERSNRGDAVLPSQVLSLYQLVHTLKGTASMLQEGAPIVRALHELETHLSSQSVASSAKELHWLTLASRSVVRAHTALLELDREDRRFAEGSPAARGLLAVAQLGGEERLVWLSLNNLVKVLPPQELAGRRVISVGGAWVPVQGTLDPRQSLGLCYRNEHGLGTVIVREVRGVTTWNEAQLLGAVRGMNEPVYATSPFSGGRAS